MAYTKRSYVEHVAVRVRDIDWHIRFFRDVLGMTIREETSAGQNPYQFWTIGGMQFNVDPDFNNCLDGLILLDVYNIPAEFVNALSRGNDAQ